MRQEIGELSRIHNTALHKTAKIRAKMARGETAAHLCLDVGFAFDLLDGALAESEAAGLGGAALLE